MGISITSTVDGHRQRWTVALVALVAIVTSLAGCSSAPPSDSTSQALAPGHYTIAVTLSGGSGKATVESPTTLVVTANSMVATVTWSSPHYTWMKVDGTTYTPVNAQGENSTFEIPVTLDTDMAVSAETTAMSTPHTIDYTLRFDSSTAKTTG